MLQVEVMPSAHEIKIVIKSAVIVERELDWSRRKLRRFRIVTAPIFLHVQSTTTVGWGRITLRSASMVESRRAEAPIASPVVRRSLRAEGLTGLAIAAFVTQLRPLIQVGFLGRFLVKRSRRAAGSTRIAVDLEGLGLDGTGGTELIFHWYGVTWKSGVQLAQFGQGTRWRVPTFLAPATRVLLVSLLNGHVLILRFLLIPEITPALGDLIAVGILTENHGKRRKGFSSVTW
jgi:hypothetical protein